MQRKHLTADKDYRYQVNGMKEEKSCNHTGKVNENESKAAGRAVEAQNYSSQGTAAGARHTFLSWKHFLTNSHSKIPACQLSGAIL